MRRERSDKIDDKILGCATKTQSTFNFRKVENGRTEIRLVSSCRSDWEDTTTLTNFHLDGSEAGKVQLLFDSPA